MKTVALPCMRVFSTTFFVVLNVIDVGVHVQSCSLALFTVQMVAQRFHQDPMEHTKQVIINDMQVPVSMYIYTAMVANLIISNVYNTAS